MLNKMLQERFMLRKSRTLTSFDCTDFFFIYLCLYLTYLIKESPSNMIFDIKCRIVYVHSDIGLGQSQIRRTYLSIRQWPRSILDSPGYFSPISDWTYALFFIAEWPEKMSVQCRIQVWTSPISDLTFA